MVQVCVSPPDSIESSIQEINYLIEGLSIITIKAEVSGSLGVDLNAFQLTKDGEVLSDDFRFTKEDSDEVIHLKMQIVKGLCGGKGGFGAQLRSLAKQKGGKQTTNFGACRDLSGRRLRHINDELILRKWQEAKEKGTAFDVEQETATGIDLWFLSAPKWADGIKVDHKRRFMKSRLKTSMCIDWLRARENGKVPQNAAKDWGCPRGSFCEYAHGEDELRGVEKEKLEEEKQQKYEDEKRKKRDDYMKPLQFMRSDEEIHSLVAEGLQAAKKAKISTDRSVATSTVLPSTSFSSTALPSSSSSAKDKSESVTKDVSKSSQSQGPLQLLSGNVIAESLQTVPLVIGNSTFATITVPESKSSAVGNWYYEVELLSDGLMQIGWIDDEFKPNSEDGIGVGDDAHSWAFDGFRKKTFHNGKEIAISYKEKKIEEKKDGESDDEDEDEDVEPSWKDGDVVGCLLSIQPIEGNENQKKVEIKYFLNGLKANPSFEFVVANDQAIFFPAMSIEEQESVRINLGHEAYKFPPSSLSISNCL